MPFDLALHPRHSGGAHQIRRAEIGNLPAKLEVSGCGRWSHSRGCGRCGRGRRRGWLCRGGRVSGGGRSGRWGSGRLRGWRRSGRRHSGGRHHRVGRDCRRGQAGSGARGWTRAGTRRWAGGRRCGGGWHGFCGHRDRNQIEFSDIPTQFCRIARDPARRTVARDAHLQPAAIAAAPNRGIGFPSHKPQYARRTE